MPRGSSVTGKTMRPDAHREPPPSEGTQSWSSNETKSPAASHSTARQTQDRSGCAPLRTPYPGVSAGGGGPIIASLWPSRGPSDRPRSEIDVSPARAVGGITENSTPSEGGSARGEASGTTMRLLHQARPTSERWNSALLTAKIAVPQLPPGLVLRPRLMKRLSDAVASRVTLVSAGAGWGKTMLVAGWAATRSSSQPVAWLSLDSFDNDPFLFWTYLAAAVNGTGEMPDGGALDELMIRPPVGAEVVRRIIVALAELPRPLVLVLDDFGEITDPGVLQGIHDLVRHPTPLRLVLITRTDPRLRLHRLRVDGELAEIRAEDLAFTESESDMLLVQAGVELTTAANRRLLDRTEGWAVGLRLAAMFAAAHGEAVRIEEFAGADTGIAEYFAEEVLAALPAERRRFLMRTSIADRPCAELADVLSEASGGQRELEALEQANAFVVALGSGHQWFRYHPLLADVLRHRLLLEEPELAPELHRRAAHWLAAQGEAVEAVRHAVRARDWQLVGELMVTVAAVRAVSAERQAFAAVLAEVPPSVFDSSAELRATAAVGCFIAHDYAGFANHVTHARAMLSKRDEMSRRPVEVFLCLADMALSRIRGDAPGVIDTATQLLRWLSEPPLARMPAVVQWEAPALSNLGVGLVWSARIDEAEEPLRASLRFAANTGAALTGVNSLRYLALIELERGHLRAAYEIANEGLEAAERRGWAELVQAIAIYLVLAQIELEWNNTDRAQVLVDAGLAAQHNDPERIAYPALQAIQARLWLARGQVDRARQVITALHAGSDLPPIPRLFSRRLTAVAAEVDLASGRPQAVLDRLRPLLDRSNTAFELSLCMARAELALGDAAAAEAELADVRDKSENPSAVALSWLITALAADHQRNDHRALYAFDRALAAAEPENIRRPFVALGDRRLEALLKHRLRLSVPGGPADRDFAAVILDELHPLDRVAVILAPLAEPLTDREQVVLSHMATLKTHEEIAAELYISINTVKDHARAVYRKLGVPNRREAVNRARELGLI